MFSDPFERQQRWINLGVFAFIGASLAWFFSPGVPVIWGPSASGQTKELGRELFEHEWTAHDKLAGGDGLGPVFNGRSCVECHFQGGIGGGGSVKQNVLTYEVHPTGARTEVEGGVIHAFAIDKPYKETALILSRIYPIRPAQVRVSNGCSIQIPAFDPVHKSSINATALFGAGWIDRISTKAITHNRFDKMLGSVDKEFQLDFSAVAAGRARKLPDGRIGRFGWKAQFATLDEFVANACAVEIGLGTPSKAQSIPLSKPDYPDQKPDLDRKQFAALVSFVDTLPRPVQSLPSDSVGRFKIERGETLFHSTGCAICHVRDLGGVAGIYSDLLLHRIHHQEDKDGGGYGPDPNKVPFPNGYPQEDEWRTPPLWGVADSAPYFHDGSCATLEDAILKHRGTATSVTKAYQKLTNDDRQALLAFLGALKAPSEALPAPTPASTTYVKR